MKIELPSPENVCDTYLSGELKLTNTAEQFCAPPPTTCTLSRTPLVCACAVIVAADNHSALAPNTRMNPIGLCALLPILEFPVTCSVFACATLSYRCLRCIGVHVARAGTVAEFIYTVKHRAWIFVLLVGASFVIIGVAASAIGSIGRKCIGRGFGTRNMAIGADTCPMARRE